MKKTIFLRSAMGAPLGITISLLLALISSGNAGNGSFSLTAPGLVSACGGELRAAWVQTLAVMAYGAVWGGASVIWEVERWSLLRQTVTHLCVALTATFPVAWGLEWMHHSWKGAAVYAGLFLFIYGAIWAGTTLTIRRHIRKINDRLQK